MRIASAAVTATPVLQRKEPPDTNSGVEARSGFYTLIGYFRETNAEFTRIRVRLTDAVQRAEAGKPGTDDAASCHAFDETRRVVRDEIEEAKNRAVAIEALRTTDPVNHARYARELVQISNGWDDLDLLWPDAAPAEAEDAAAQKKRLDDSLASAKNSIKLVDAVIFLCACQSIPRELDDYLENYQIGKGLDFISTFRDQLPDDKSTRMVLEWLAPQSGIVCGLVDLDSAKIIKADQRLWRQLISAVIVLAVAGLGFGLAAIAVHLGAWLRFNPADWPVTPDQWAALNGAYLLVLLGVFGHWVLDRVKQNRAGTDAAPLAEWRLWIHINEVPITVRIASVWLLILLAVSFRTFDLTKGVQPLTYFTAGYFMDSVFDALIGRLNTFMSANDPAGKKS